MTDLAREDPVRDLDADAIRARLVAAAADVFAEKGYEGAGVQEIARRAGLTTGAIYSRFRGKAELLAEAIRGESGNQLDELFAPGAVQLDAARLIRHAGKQLPQRERTQKQFLLLEAFVAARRDPEVAAVMREHMTTTREIFRRVIDLGHRGGDLDDAVDADALAHFSQAVALGFLLYEAIDAPSPDLDAWTDLIDRLVGSLQPDPATDPSSQTEAAQTNGEQP
jgi:TetR/AcrR family transcriptional repressor of uid operon